MPRAALTQDEIAAFRESLREAATRRFAEHGYAGVTLRGLARDLGCSPMTPYRYFRDKDEIFALVRAAAYERFAAAQEAAGAAPGSPLLRLRALGRAYLRFALEEPDHYRIMFQLDQPETRKPPELMEQELRGWLPMRRTVAECVEAGELSGEPDELAHLFWSATHGLASLHLAGKLRLGCSLDELFEPLLDLLFRGARPEPRTRH